MTYAFFNFNTYLGGGETLIVRLAEYLQKEQYCFKIFYKVNSYIEKDLKRVDIDDKYLCPISSPESYYYLNNKGREWLRNEICGYLDENEDICLISLNSRELYTIVDIAKVNTQYKVAHLILHNQDNLYVCQSLFDKLKLEFGGKRTFSLKKQIAFNRALYNVICEQSIVIPQSELQAELLQDEFDIGTERDKAVPLPACDFSRFPFKKGENQHKILWIGRIVDFKLPALLVIFNFIARRSEYSLTVIGDGEMDKIHEYIKQYNIPDNRISFLGKVDYSKLGDVINQHSIGYAMGTSIIEIGKYGLPVIMALGSPDYKKFEKDICGGLYSHQSRGNVGDTLYYKKSKDPIVLIDDAFSEIDNNYEDASLTCYETLKKNFDENTDFNLYMELLSQAKPIKTDLNIPQASWLRKKLFNRLWKV